MLEPADVASRPAGDRCEPYVCMDPLLGSQQMRTSWELEISEQQHADSLTNAHPDILEPTWFVAQIRSAYKSKRELS